MTGKTKKKRETGQGQCGRMDALGDVKDTGNQCIRQYFHKKKIQGKTQKYNAHIREVSKYRIYQKK